VPQSEACAVPDDAIIAILAMAIAAYGVRAGGLIIGRRLPQTGLVANWLHEIPTAILVAVVAPDLLRGGPAELGGAAITALMAWATRNLFLAIVSGVLWVYCARNWVQL
jgi:uncharacterized membrane protein